MGPGYDISDVIKKRRSVRTFEKKALTDEDYSRIKDFLSEV